MNIVMTPVTNRGVSRAELRRRIEGAALALFESHGYEAVSVDRIVGEARVSKGAFFIFFPGKADVLAVVAAAISDQLLRAAETVPTDRPLAALVAFAEASEAVLASRRPLSRALCRHLSGKGGERTGRDAWVRLVERLQTSGGIDPDLDPGATGRLLSDLWFGAALTWLCDEEAGASLAADLTPRLRLAFTGLAA